jgi:endoribonuclease Dicer
VVIHDIILASAMGTTAAYASKQAAIYALDAIEGDPDFMTRACDCRVRTQAKKTHKKALKQMLASLQEQSEDQQAVEDAIIIVDDDDDGVIAEVGDNIQK